MFIPDDYASMFKSKKPFLFKYRVEAGNQKYDAICWYKVHGYWKQKGDWFWKPLGIVIKKDDWGKVKPGMEKIFMQETQKVFIDRLKHGTLIHSPFGRVNTGVSSVPVEKIVEQLVGSKR